VGSNPTSTATCKTVDSAYAEISGVVGVPVHDGVAIFEAGRKALTGWLAGDHASETQIRDPALLKLAFSDLGSAAALRALAAAQADIHRHWAQEYGERVASLSAEDPATPSRQRVLGLGLAIESAYEKFWAQLAGN
jgi:PadR family transcriptional regulator AphA